MDISKYEERDAVSFYEPLARMLKAKEFDVDVEEYTKQLREFKSGKVEHHKFRK